MTKPAINKKSIDILKKVGYNEVTDFTSVDRA